MKDFNSRRKKRNSVVKEHSYAAIENRNFSAVEDSPDSFSIIGKLANRAAINAANEAKAAGLTHTFVRGHQIIRLHTDGREEIVSSSNDEQIKGGSFYIHYTPTVLQPRGK